MHHQDIALLYFTQAKGKLWKAASKILESICQCFHLRYGEHPSHDTDNAYVQEKVTHNDIQL